MIQVVDSAGGTITEAYDNLDRLTSETTPQGQISYGYDLAGRRATMTVAGQPQVNYTYDNANRLTQIAQGTSTVGFSYDTVNRRSALTLSNGVNMAYTYDNDSRVTGITYKFNANPLGNLTYTYDSLGRRTQVGGSFAQTGFPAAVTSATYDAANELTNWNGTTISYDLNGNMLSDGANTFSWNARNQVATLNSVSLQYDGFGRRTKNLQNTSFLFDGANAVQELSGSTASANLITGGIDEIFARADSTGAFTPLQDALGSTIALVDSGGNVVTTYGYDPFGNTAISGAASANPSQYTGRESEGNGLYFYRARYYSPLLGKFISQDPLGFAGSGPNFYAYAGNDPVDFRDPFGLTGPGTVVAGVAGTTATAAEVDAVVAPLVEDFATDMGLGAGFGATVETGSAGGPLGVAALAIGATAYFEVSDANAELNANAAYDAEWQSVIAYNNAILAHPRPSSASLAGRYTDRDRRPGQPGNGDKDCDQQWENARAYCADLLAMPRNSPEWKKYQELWGGNYNRCVKGQVDERCGGSHVEY
jgi:RHS repeat-associated protein